MPNVGGTVPSCGKTSYYTGLHWISNVLPLFLLTLCNLCRAKKNMCTARGLTLLFIVFQQCVNSYITTGNNNSVLHNAIPSGTYAEHMMSRNNLTHSTEISMYYKYCAYCTACFPSSTSSVFLRIP